MRASSRAKRPQKMSVFIMRSFCLFGKTTKKKRKKKTDWDEMEEK